MPLHTTISLYRLPTAVTPTPISNKLNQVKAGVVLNYVIIGLNIVTGLLYTPFMLRCLGQSQYGLYSLVASVIAYLTLLDFGFGSAIVRYTAKIRATESQQSEWSLYGMFLSAYAVIGLLVVIAGTALYFNVDRMFDATMTADELSQARIMMGLMVFNLAVTFPFSIFGSIISAYEHFVFQRTVSILRILLSTAVMIAVLLMGYKAVAMVVVQTVFSIGTLLANVLYCRYRLRIRITFGRFNYALLREVMVFSWWNFLAIASDRIYWGTGQFVLGVVSGTVAVAVFSVAISLMNMYMSMSTSLNNVLLPRITRMATDPAQDGAISDLFIRTGRLQFCVISLILCTFAVIGRDFIALWAGPGYEDSFLITLIFFIALLCPVIQNVGITILLARDQLKFRALSYLVAAAVNLIGQIFAGRTYGAIGCAWVIGATFFIGQWIAMSIYYARRQRLGITHFWMQILRMAVAPAVVVAAGLFAAGHVTVDTWPRLMLLTAAFLAVYLPAFWFFSMNTYERSQVLAPLAKLKIVNGK